jgi:peptidoglycan/xylan/chitin deacetylase (PgdA/CDA1 family)
MTGGLLALTFDDGPDPEITPQLLDILEQYHVPATFFLLGCRITSETTPILQRAVMLGCEMCNHSYSHPYLTVLTPRQITQEVSSATQRIILTTGQTPRFFRPPYLAVREDMFPLISMPFIGGYGVRDYDESVSESERYSGVMRIAKDGRIILLHDFAENTKTVGAVKRLVPDLLARGFRFVTVSQLFQEKGVTPSNEDRIIYSYPGQTAMYAPDAT